MPECVFAERRLNSTRRSIEPSRSSASKPSNGSTGTGAAASTSWASCTNTPRYLRLGQRIRDREVGDRGREQHRAVRLLRPEEPDDVGGLLRVREVAHELLEPPARAAVELADIERAAAADEDPARLEVVGAEVHERAHRPLWPDPAGDLRLVDPVLERDDEAVGREPRRDRRERGVRVLRLDREQHGVQLAGELARATRPRAATVNVSTGPSIVEPARVDRGDVVGIGVAEEHRMAVAGEPRADRPADRARADDDVVGHATCSTRA